MSKISLVFFCDNLEYICLSVNMLLVYCFCMLIYFEIIFYFEFNDSFLNVKFINCIKIYTIFVKWGCTEYKTRKEYKLFLRQSKNILVKK